MKNVGFVYIITDGTYHKIGMTTTSVKSRLKQMQTGNANKLDIVSYQLLDDCFTIEQHLHRKYNSYRFNGEWFKFENSNNIVSLVNELKDTKDNIHTFNKIIKENENRIFNATQKKIPKMLSSKRANKIKALQEKRLKAKMKYEDSKK